MQVSVHFFSTFSHDPNIDQAQVELATGATVSDLLEALAGLFGNPVFRDDEFLLMVNYGNASTQRVLMEGDLVFLLPIMAGG